MQVCRSKRKSFTHKPDVNTSIKSKDAQGPTAAKCGLKHDHSVQRWLTSALPLRLCRMSDSAPNTLNYKQTQMPQIPLSLETVG